MEQELLHEARKYTAFNNILSFNFDNVNDSDIKEFAKEYYKVIDVSERSDVMCDFVCEKDVLPFTKSGMQSDEWFYQFEQYLMELWSDKIKQYLSDELSIYVNDTCREMGY